jgi:glutathione synthase/RimK-type ligase-like ATP-grasp enzyme
LISSRPREVLDFVERHQQNVIAKAVKHGFLDSAKGMNLIFTAPLQLTDLVSIGTADSVVPAIVQPRLDKECDLRITVVGELVFPVAILSQRYDETSVDWRTWDLTGVDLEHKRFDLPEALRAQCLELNHRLNLGFSCIDMVQTKNGDFYFLEVNPNGQWAWIEDLVHFPIRDSIIDLLTQ